MDYYNDYLMFQSQNTLDSMIANAVNIIAKFAQIPNNSIDGISQWQRINRIINTNIHVLSIWFMYCFYEWECAVYWWSYPMNWLIIPSQNMSM